ncbi:MAG: hypothetical protein LBR64_00835 [Dysgonamonadaceae bacterium]|jgi:hypothetical protein|nr:hypothetical protein [Dysgonamonadaceae bacterium]
MDKRLNELLTRKILTKIPNNIKPIDYLIEVLGIGKESVYRRMRSEIPFTFEEITKIAINLGLSIDEIIGWNKRERVFFDLNTSSCSPAEDSFSSILGNYQKYLDLACESRDLEIMVTVNKIISLFAIISDSDTIFKFYYYRWLQQGNRDIQDMPLSEIAVPKHILEAKKEIKAKIERLDNVSVILDKDAIIHSVREIQYYFNRKLITNDEIQMLKTELKLFLEYFERLMLRGYNLNGKAYHIYLSLLSVASNSIYCRYGSNFISHYWIYETNSVAIMSMEMCQMHKRWIDSLKKSSVLITQSNEILQAAFLSKQKEYIESITNDLYYYG